MFIFFLLPIDLREFSFVIWKRLSWFLVSCCQLNKINAKSHKLLQNINSTENLSCCTDLCAIIRWFKLFYPNAPSLYPPNTLESGCELIEWKCEWNWKITRNSPRNGYQWINGIDIKKNSPQEMSLGKGVLKICTKSKSKCQSVNK